MQPGSPPLRHCAGETKLRAVPRQVRGGECAGKLPGALRAIAAVSLVAWGSSGGAQLATPEAASDGSTPYTVNCTAGAGEAGECTVDRVTYVGWQVFHRTCHVCHAANAVGSDFAPNLLQRVRQMDSRGFLSAMEMGYAGDAEMPPWGQNAVVRPYVLELWRYLSARANGDLPPGEPRRAPVLSSQE